MSNSTTSNISVLYEDNHLFAVIKPPNMPVQADNSGDLDLLSLLKRDIKVRYRKPGNVYLALLHRLDRPVGGVMLFAKTSKAATRLSKQFRDGIIDKRYAAVVHGKVPDASLHLTDFLLKNRDTNTVSVVSSSVKGAKQAQLIAQKVEEKQQFSLVSVTLLSGRSHQIRVQLAHAGFPIVGDHRYGLLNETGMIALWSCSLSCIHPISGDRLRFSAHPEQHFPWNLFNTVCI